MKSCQSKAATNLARKTPSAGVKLACCKPRNAVYRASPLSQGGGPGGRAGQPASTPYGSSFEVVPVSLLDEEEIFGDEGSKGEAEAIGKLGAGLDDLALSLTSSDEEEGADDDVDDDGFIDIDSNDEFDEVMPEGFWDTDLERVYLVGVATKSGSNRTAKDSHTVALASSAATGRQAPASSVGYGIDESLEELGRLADTAGLKVVGSTSQVLRFPSAATYIGRGKVKEVATAVRHYKVDTVIFDDELTPAQLRNLERAFGGEEGTVKVCDRTALILDIFSQRAATREGKLQVELAQVEYQLPRLNRMWTHLDRVGGGGQVKGTGEKQKEMDKRELREKAGQLKKELELVRLHRRTYRERRSATPIPVVAIVGYTNAGKSTLLNTLTNAGVLAEDKLFATLDNTARRIRLKGNQEVIISDTVGFIQKLPTELVAAFRATLEETRDASLILHVVDISHPNAAAQYEAVNEVLASLDVGNIPIVTAWNKVDACQDPNEVRRIATQREEPTVCISGRTGEGLEEMQDLVSSKLGDMLIPVEVLLPYANGGGELVDTIHRTGTVSSCDYTEEGVLMKASVPPSVAGRLIQYSLVPIELPKPAPRYSEDFGPTLDSLNPDWDKLSGGSVADALV